MNNAQSDFSAPVTDKTATPGASAYAASADLTAQRLLADSSDTSKGGQLQNVELLKDKEQPAGALSAVWKAAYEELPNAATGIAATAALIGVSGAIAYATKGRSWGKPNVLIIEDTIEMGKAYSDALTASGHKVTWVTNIKSLNPLIGTSPTGGEIALKSNKWKVAFVDGDLGKDVLTGPEIISTLTQKRMLAIGTSTIEDFNIAMRANGAGVALNKAHLYTALYGNKVDLRAAMKAPEAAQTNLTTFMNDVKSKEHEALRQAASKQMMSYYNFK